MTRGLLHEVITVTPRPGRQRDVVAAIAADARHAAWAAWFTLAGGVPRVYLIRAIAERDAAWSPDDLPGAGRMAEDQLAQAVEHDVYRGLPVLPALDRAAGGALCEWRAYELQPYRALDLAIEGWGAVLGARLAIAPVTAVMHSENGLLPRLLHIYPYASLAEREAIRRAAVATGVWPPKGGAVRNRVMRAEIVAPLEAGGAPSAAAMASAEAVATVAAEQPASLILLTIAARPGTVPRMLEAVAAHPPPLRASGPVRGWQVELGEVNALVFLLACPAPEAARAAIGAWARPFADRSRDAWLKDVQVQAGQATSGVALEALLRGPPRALWWQTLAAPGAATRQAGVRVLPMDGALDRVMQLIPLDDLDQAVTLAHAAHAAGVPLLDSRLLVPLADWSK